MADTTTAKCLAAVVAIVAILTALAQAGVDHGPVEAATGVKVTSLTPVAYQIRANIPQLDAVQQCMVDRVTLPVIADPESSVRQPKIVTDANTLQVWMQLLFTESSFYQWEPRGDENTEDCAFIWENHEGWELRNSGPDPCGPGLCVGLGALSDSLGVSDSDRADPFQNAYESLRYFVGLVEDYDGDFTKAVAAYKGARNTLADGTVVVNPMHPHVVMLFDQLTITTK